MEKSVRTHLLVQAALNLAANLITNGLIAWLLNKSAATLPGIAVDMAITAPILTWLVSFLATYSTRKGVRAGTAPKTAWRRADHSLLRWLPTSNALRALVLAVGATILLVTVICGLLAVFGVAEMRTGTYVLFKALYTGTLGAAAAWVSTLAVLGEPASRPVMSASAD
jgi:hypothetical protein